MSTSVLDDNPVDFDDDDQTAYAERFPDAAEPTIVIPTVPTQDAPYGFTKDGTPRRKPGPAKGTRTATGSKGPRAGGGPRKSSGPTSRRTTGVDYQQGILGLLQLPAFALGAAGQVNPALALDGAAIAVHAPGIAAALNDLAADNPIVAGALDKILGVGPYGAIIGACIPLFVQIAANHRKLPDEVVRGMGGMPADAFAQYVSHVTP